MPRTLWVLTVMPLVSLVVSMFCLVSRPFDRRRRLFGWVLRSWSRLMLWLCGARWRAQGLPAGLERCFLVGNHVSAIDIPLLVAAVSGDLRFMAKHTLFRIPFFGWAMRWNGFIPVDRTSARRAARSIDRMLERLDRDLRLIAVFAEGTRSEDGSLQPFRRGLFTVLKRAGIPVLPFYIGGTREVVRRGRWRVRAGRVSVRFGTAIAPEEVQRLTPDQLLERVRERVLALAPQEETRSSAAPEPGAPGSCPAGADPP